MNPQFTEEQIKLASDAIAAIHGVGPDPNGMWRDAAMDLLKTISGSKNKDEFNQFIRGLAETIEYVSDSRISQD